MNFIIDNFDRLFNSEESLKRLEEIILDLAVKGKLAPQYPNDEPASILLERIKAEKEQLVKEKKIKKDKDLEPITQEEIPFEIPKTWQWVRLADVIDVRDGTHDTPKYVEYGIPLVTSKNLDNGSLNFNSCKFISKEDHDNISLRSGVDNNDILFAMIGSIGNPVLVKKDRDFSIKNVALFKCHGNLLIYPEYLFTFLLYGQNIMKKIATGGVQKFVSLSFLRNYLLPLPPLAEQKRIVEKVDKLKELINQFREKIQKRDKVRQGLKASIMNEIEKSNSNHDLLENLELIFRNFDSVVKTKEDIKDIRDLVLSLAVKGKLVPQDSNDESANALLEKIKAEKEQLIKDKKIKKDKDLTPITEEEIPFEIPESWEWVRLGEISNYGNNTSILPQNIDDDVWTLELEDIEKESSIILKTVYNSERQVKSNKHLFNKGDVLYSKLRPYLKKILVAPEKGVCTSEIIPFRAYGSILSEYIVKVMKSSYIDNYVNSITHGMNMPRLGTENARNICFPLPPLVEQKRIVLQVEKLMKVCDELEKLVEKSQKEESLLMGSIMNGFVG